MELELDQDVSIDLQLTREDQLDLSLVLTVKANLLALLKVVINLLELETVVSVDFVERLVAAAVHVTCDWYVLEDNAAQVLDLG